MPLRASRAVRALAYVAMVMPNHPEMIEVTAPTRNAIVENAPLYRAGACLIPSASVCHLVENPSWELSRMKMNTEKPACPHKTPQRFRTNAARLGFLEAHTTRADVIEAPIMLALRYPTWRKIL